MRRNSGGEQREACLSRLEQRLFRDEEAKTIARRAGDGFSDASAAARLQLVTALGIACWRKLALAAQNSMFCTCWRGGTNA